MARIRERRVLLGVRPDPEDGINWILAHLRIHQPPAPNGSGKIKDVEVRVGVSWLLLRAAERTGVKNAPWAIEDVLVEAGCQESALEPETAATAEGS